MQLNTRLLSIFHSSSESESEESESESGGENDKLVSIPLIDDESDDFDDSAEHAVETVKLIQEKDSSSSSFESLTAKSTSGIRLS